MCGEGTYTVLVKYCAARLSDRGVTWCCGLHCVRERGGGRAQICSAMGRRWTAQVDGADRRRVAGRSGRDSYCSVGSMRWAQGGWMGVERVRGDYVVGARAGLGHVARAPGDP